MLDNGKLFPSVPRRLLRALLYWLIILCVLLASLYIGSKAPIPNVIGNTWMHLVYIMCIGLLVSLTYVNVYVLYPTPEIDASVREKELRRTAGKLTIIIVLSLFFLLPTIFYAYWIAQNIRARFIGALFIALFLLLPAFGYFITLFLKSGQFYSKDKIDIKLFLFRHQLITPGMLLITVPFCCGYVLSRPTNWPVAFISMLFIELAYLIFCFTKYDGLISLSLLGKTVRLNLFCFLNICLLIVVIIVSFFLPTNRFVTFAVWLGLYMTSFEFWTSVYFKSTENEIRGMYGFEVVELESKYDKYYSAAASSFTFLLLVSPSSFLCDQSLKCVYLVIVFFTIFIIWFKWIYLANDYLKNKELFKNIRSYKWMAVMPAVAVVFDSWLNYFPSIDTGSRNFLIGLCLACLFGFFIAIFFGKVNIKKARRRTRYYWVGGVGMGVYCIILSSLYELSTERFLCLAWSYFFGMIIVIILIVLAEWDLIEQVYKRKR